MDQDYWEDYPENSYEAEELYYDLGGDDIVETNRMLISNLKRGMEDRDCFKLYTTIGAIRLLEKMDKLEISQKIWQLAYMCLVYCLETLLKRWGVGVGESSPQEFQKMQQVRIDILEKLKPTIAAKKITKFIRSAADRIKAAKIIQKHYIEYLYKPDVYVKSAISKPARLRFSKK
jgi:hypothetical protein